MIWSPAASPASPPATLSLFPTPQPLPLEEKWQARSCPRALAPDAPSTQRAAPSALHAIAAFESLSSWLKGTPFSDHPLQSRTPSSTMSPCFIAFTVLRTLKIPFSFVCSLSVCPDQNVCKLTSGRECGTCLIRQSFACAQNTVRRSGGVKWVISPARPLSLCRTSLSSHAPACGRNVTCLHISAEGPCPACCPVGKALGAGLHLRFGRAPRLNCNAVQITGCPGEAVRPRFHGRFRR